jgi:hypothetical protein
VPADPGGIIRRATTRVVPTERQRLSSGTPDTALVRRYAEAVTRSARWKRERDSLIRAARAEGDTARADSIAQAPSTDSTGNRLPPVAGRYDGKRLVLTLSRADGRILEATAKLAPRWEFAAGQGGASDTVVQWRDDRWWYRQVREAGDCLPESVLLGGGAGALAAGGNAKRRLTWAAFGTVAAELVCLIAD